jgi:hypothetical protein
MSPDAQDQRPPLAEALASASDAMKSSSDSNLANRLEEKAAELADATESEETEEPPSPKSAVKRMPLSERFKAKKVKKLESRKKEVLEDLKKTGLSPDVLEQHANAILAREQYDKLSLSEKVTRLEQMVVQGFQGIGGEMRDLQHNDFELADAMDVNFRALSKVMAKLNVPPEEMVRYCEEARAEMAAERAEFQKKQQAARETKAAEATSATPNVPAADAGALKAVGEVAEKREVTKEIDKAGEAPPEPEAATVFGG